MKIRLSQNSGYYINRFGIRFFSHDPTGKINKEKDILSQIDFNYPLDETQQWITLCDTFPAKGGEEFLVMGRYAESRYVHVQPINPKHINKLDVNRSAYYLVDNLELFTTSFSTECGCNREQINFEDVKEIIPGNKVILSNVHFESNSAALLDSSIPELEKLKNLLESKPAVRISIIGHTDDLGDENYNLVLSQKRAKAVKDWLVSNGILSERLTDTGYGFAVPLTDNSTEEKRQLNRRVEIVIE
jgi:outer membrane protein OmpA-like peptidoglycan-associated protein